MITWLSRIYKSARPYHLIETGNYSKQAIIGGITGGLIGWIGGLTIDGILALTM